MSELNCNACNDLQEYAPDFVDYGVTDEIAKSLAANTGLNPNLDVLHEDCEDLNDANDCLIGMLPNTVESYKVCDWQEFMLNFLGNLYNLLKAMIASICGLWTNAKNLWSEISSIWNRLTVVSYVGTMKLYTDTDVWGTSGTSPQTPAFTKYKRSGNMPSGVLTATGNYKSIKVNNTLSVPILVNATFCCCISSDQPLSSCYLVVTKDGAHMGQTPFVTPSTYDQQVQMEPFILQPGSQATLSYYFGIGGANAWFISQFGGTGAIRAKLVPKDNNNPAVQESYFIVQATTVVAN